jgi:hypothetical protein
MPLRGRVPPLSVATSLHPPFHRCRIFVVLPLQKGTTVQSVGPSEFNLENLRKHLQRMPDEELIRFGKACREILTLQANLGRPRREVFVVQLQEARKEWRYADILNMAEEYKFGNSVEC